MDYEEVIKDQITVRVRISCGYVYIRQEDNLIVIDVDNVSRFMDSLNHCLAMSERGSSEDKTDV